MHDTVAFSSDVDINCRPNRIITFVYLTVDNACGFADYGTKIKAFNILDN